MHKPTSNATHAKSENCCGKDFLSFLISSKKNLAWQRIITGSTLQSYKLVDGLDWVLLRWISITSSAQKWRIHYEVAESWGWEEGFVGSGSVRARNRTINWQKGIFWHCHSFANQTKQQISNSISSATPPTAHPYMGGFMETIPWRQIFYLKHICENFYHNLGEGDIVKRKNAIFRCNVVL